MIVISAFINSQRINLKRPTLICFLPFNGDFLDCIMKNKILLTRNRLQYVQCINIYRYYVPKYGYTLRTISQKIGRRAAYKLRGTMPTSQEVREYFISTRRCSKCRGYNHSSKSGHSEQSFCVNGTEMEHGKECRSLPHCSNCGEAHNATDRSYFYYKLDPLGVTLSSSRGGGLRAPMIFWL